jgi:REP element-mobilizing transposase RayT
MTYDPEKHHRRSIRLKGYDYASPGWYYVTICTYERQFLFGEIVRDQMRPSTVGTIAQECWNEIPRHFPCTALDVSVVMPNHLHGILVIEGRKGHAMACPYRPYHGMPSQPTQPLAAFGKPVPGSLATIVGLLKQAVTRRAKAESPSELAHVWHNNYYEHIIRNEKELNRIREYICTNPLRWRYDVENPACDSEAADDIEELLAADDDEL